MVNGTQSEVDADADLALLRAAVASSSALMEALGRALSHDVRTPVRQAGKFIEFVQEGADAELDANARDLLSLAGSSLERADLLISGLRELTQLKPQPASMVHLSELMPEVVAELPMGALVFACGGLPPVHGNLEQLRRLLREVLANAVRYRSEQVGRIAVTTVPIDGGICMIVEDDGLGIPAGVVGHVCEPFHRAHPEISEGVGLGLTMARRIAELHGGWLEIESEEGAGTRVSIALRRPVSEVSL